MTQSFEDIMVEEEICVKCNDMQEKKKLERFDKLIVVQEKLMKPQEKMVELLTASMDTKMLIMKRSDLDPQAAKIV
ncbi:hypothetical protein D1007_41412 [Hordeum vulgare]|nr:hypothetical protein D1007_41412 [Hordeum vulgare]